MKILYSIILCHFFLGIQSQELRRIVVIDSISRLPIPFVAIQTSDNEGIYSDESGQFYINKVNIDSIISFKTIGYKNLILTKQNLTDSIFLSPKVEVLQEIDIGVTFKQEEIGLHNKPTNFTWNIEPKREFITSLTFDRRFIKSHLEKVHVPIKKISGLNNTDIKAALRINIYTSCTQNNLLDKFFESQPVYCDSNLKGRLIFDISDAVIEINKECIYIGLEFLGFINEKGEIQQNMKGTLSVPFTKKKTKEFSSNTYIKPMFSENDEWIPINNIIEKYTNLNGDYSLPIGLTISSRED